jgi:hypothetical protein
MGPYFRGAVVSPQKVFSSVIFLTRFKDGPSQIHLLLFDFIDEINGTELAGEIGTPFVWYSIVSKFYFSNEKRYEMKKNGFRNAAVIFMTIQASLLTLSCQKKPDDNSDVNSEPRLGIEYLDDFAPGEAVFSIVFDDDPENGSGMNILLWDGLTYESTCKDTFASDFANMDDVNYLLLTLNDTVPGKYPVVGPADAFAQSIIGSEGKRAAVSYRQEYDESKQDPGPYGHIEDRHYAYSGEVEVKNNIGYDFNNLDSLIDATVDLKIKASFAKKDVRAVECNGALNLVDGGLEVSCICKNPDGSFYECQAEDIDDNCCPDPSADTIEYQFDVSAPQCGYYCGQSINLNVNYCAALLPKADLDNKPICTPCESQDSTRIFVNATYPDGRQIDLSNSILNLAYRRSKDYAEYEQPIVGGPSLPEGYDYIWSFGTITMGSTVLLRATLSNGITKEVEVPHVYTGCIFRNVTYLVIIVTEEEDDITFSEPVFINPCDDKGGTVLNFDP